MAFLEMPTKPVTTRATPGARAGCIQRGLGRKTPCSRRGSRDAAEDDPRPSILQLNTEVLTTNKISVLEQLAYMNKVVLQDSSSSYRRPTA